MLFVLTYGGTVTKATNFIMESPDIIVCDLTVAPESSTDYWVLFNQQYNAVTKAISDLDVATSNALINTTTTFDKDRVVLNIKKVSVALQNCKSYSLIAEK